jgi:hypothetical protein
LCEHGISPSVGWLHAFWSRFTGERASRKNRTKNERRRDECLNKVVEYRRKAGYAAKAAVMA